MLPNLQALTKTVSEPDFGVDGYSLNDDGWDVVQITAIRRSAVRGKLLAWIESMANFSEKHGVRVKNLFFVSNQAIQGRLKIEASRVCGEMTGCTLAILDQSWIVDQSHQPKFRHIFEDLFQMTPSQFETLLKPQIIVPPNILDILSSGDFRRWEEGYAKFLAIRGSPLSPEEELAFVVNFDIARVRSLEAHTEPLVFGDTGWMSHYISIWVNDPYFRRWLEQLGEVALRRKSTGYATERVMYVPMGEARSPDDLKVMIATILDHLRLGIDVILADESLNPTLTNYQLFTRKDSIVSRDWEKFTMEQLFGPDCDEIREHVDTVHHNVGSMAYRFDQSSSVGGIREIVEWTLGKC